MKKSAFTLTEILIAMAILGIIMAIAVPSIKRSQVSAREAALKADLRAMRDAMERFNNDVGAFPLNPADLASTNAPASGLRVDNSGTVTTVAIDPAKWDGPYLRTVPTPDGEFSGSPAGTVAAPHGWVYDVNAATIQQNWLQAPSTAISTEGTPYNTW